MSPKTPKKKSDPSFRNFREHAVMQLVSLQNRVALLERDTHDMRSDMNKLSEELGALRVAVRHVDERTLRGEKLMLEMQLEQHRQSRVLNRIADALHVARDDTKKSEDK